MAKYLIRRFVNYVVLVAIAASLAYLLAASSLDPKSNYLSKHPRPPISVINAELTQLNLNPDTPIFVRYGKWVDGVVHGDLGKTWQNTSVNAEFGRRVWVSTRLLVIATILGSVIGVLVGAWGAIKQYKFFDRSSTLLSFFFLSMPVFVIGIGIQVGANYLDQAIGVNLLPTTFMTTPGITGFWATLGSSITHLILPTLSLILSLVASISRYQRSTMLDVLGSDFLRTARAKGLRRRQALTKHGLRTAVIPITTLITYNVVLLFTGAVFTEQIFGWNGMGIWFVQSIDSNDVNSVAAINLFIAILVLVAGMLSDLIYVALDPRARAR
jgi:peptide/nickel transport system permease protein